MLLGAPCLFPPLYPGGLHSPPRHRLGCPASERASQSKSADDYYTAGSCYHGSSNATLFRRVTLLFCFFTPSLLLRRGPSASSRSLPTCLERRANVDAWSLDEPISRVSLDCNTAQRGATAFRDSHWRTRDDESEEEPWNRRWCCECRVTRVASVGLSQLTNLSTKENYSALKSKKKVRMLSSLANYLLGGNIYGAQESREASNKENLESLPIMARLSQVEVEGDDWILIDRADSRFMGDSIQTLSVHPEMLTVEDAMALEESWYVTPPACFTRAGPVNVETSPLEDLLIEHPSMSVYRATASPVAPDTPPPTPDAPQEAEDEATSSHRATQRPSLAESNAIPRGIVQEQAQSRRPAIHDGRPARSAVSAEKFTLVQIRSTQKVLEKRSTQALKRSRLERSNKLREVLSVKGKRPRRQDRLRIQNSGANNNRKC